MRGVLLAVLSVFGSGCISVEVVELPAFSRAMKMAGPERPKLFWADSVDIHSLPAMAPYAQIIGLGGGKDQLARAIWRKGAELKADVVLLYDTGMREVGQVHTYWGFGITTSQPTYKRSVEGFCFRICPARLGILCDESNMVLSMDENLKESGLLEGDTILSIDGVPWEASSVKSGRFLKLLGLEAGGEVKLIWIRPGTGRMEGMLKAMANPPSHLEIEDALPWVPPPPPDYYDNSGFGRPRR